jgi:hypothetical protein
VFLINSCPENFRCGPVASRYARYELKVESTKLKVVITFSFYLFTFYSYHTECDTTRQTLSRSYGRLFAEFLEEHSLVRLGLLDLITCVGLRYGFLFIMLRGFSWKRALSNFN